MVVTLSTLDSAQKDKMKRKPSVRKQKHSLPGGNQASLHRKTGNYAEAVLRGPARTTVSLGVRVCPQDLDRTHKAPTHKRR